MLVKIKQWKNSAIHKILGNWMNREVDSITSRRDGMGLSIGLNLDMLSLHLVTEMKK